MNTELKPVPSIEVEQQLSNDIIQKIYDFLNNIEVTTINCDKVGDYLKHKATANKTTPEAVIDRLFAKWFLGKEDYLPFNTLLDFLCDCEVFNIGFNEKDAMDYLSRNDPSLKNSFALAFEENCEFRSIDSRLLAELHASSIAYLDFVAQTAEINAFFDELRTTANIEKMTTEQIKEWAKEPANQSWLDAIDEMDDAHHYIDSLGESVSWGVVALMGMIQLGIVANGRNSFYFVLNNAPCEVSKELYQHIVQPMENGLMTYNFNTWDLSESTL